MLPPAPGLALPVKPEAAIPVPKDALPAQPPPPRRCSTLCCGLLAAQSVVSAVVRQPEKVHLHALISRLCAHFVLGPFSMGFPMSLPRSLRPVARWILPSTWLLGMARPLW